MWGPKILLMAIPTGGVGGRLLGDFSAATQACLRQHTKQLLHFLLLRARSQVASNPRFAGVLHVNCYTSGKKYDSLVDAGSWQSERTGTLLRLLNKLLVGHVIE